MLEEFHTHTYLTPLRLTNRPL